MRIPSPHLRLVLIAAALVSASTCVPTVARAGGLRVLQSDASGVLFQLDPAEFQPAPGAGVQKLPIGDFEATAIPSRPALPFASALIAVPPGARVSASVVEDGGEQAFEGVALSIVPRPVFRESDQTGDLQPYNEPAEAIRDGVWPAAPVDLSTPFSVRRQRLVGLQVYPYRYDAESGRLYVRRALKVRVSFSGGSTRSLSAAPEDRSWDPIWNNVLANASEGRRWREAAPPLAARPALGRKLAGASPNAVTAFDENQPEVRVKLDSTAVYALDFDALAAAGYPAGVPNAEVSVHRHEFVEDVQVPYVTIELPIELQDWNANGVFDSGDRILVWSQNWAQRADASRPQRAWGDAEVVYVTRLAGGAGLRVSTRSGWRNGVGLFSPPSYPAAIHFEKDYWYNNAGTAFADTLNDAFHWTDQTLYYSRPETLLFATDHIDTTHAVSFATAYQGRSSGTHWMWAQVKNASGAYTSVTDSAGFAGRTELVSNATLFGSALSEGRTNRLRVWGKAFTAPPDPTTNANALAALNYFDVTYWRTYAPIAGYLACNSADVSGAFELASDGFADSTTLRVYDVTSPGNPVRLSGVVKESTVSGFRLRLQDSTALGERRDYVVFDAPKSPPASAYSAVTRAGLYGSSGADYLLVGPAIFLAAAEELAQLRESQGMRVLRAPVDAIYDEFNGGRKSAYALKRFFRYAYNRWDTRYVLLLGDGSIDPRPVDPTSSRDFVPTQRIMGPVLASTTSGSFLEAISSDNWLGWCLNCSQPELAPRLPDLHVGRLPANTVAVLDAVVDKLVAYESFAGETWRRGMTLISDDAYSTLSTFGGNPGTSNYCRKDYEDVFRLLNERVKSAVLDSAGLSTADLEVFNLSYYLPNNTADITPCPQTPDTCRCSLTNTQSRARLTALPELVQRVNAGKLWVNYQGHANEYVLAHEEFWRSNGVQRGTDYNLLLNDGRPFFFSAFSCHPNAFAHEAENSNRKNGDCVGAMLVDLGNRRGAVASWASAGYEVLPLNSTTHLNVTLAKTMFAEPPRDAAAGDSGATARIGEILTQTLIRNWQFTRNSAYEADVGVSYTLLGDPATQLSIGLPQGLVTVNGQDVTSGQVVRLRQGGDTLALVADVMSNVRLDSLTLQQLGPNSAITTIPPSKYSVTPSFGDTSFASRGGRRYRLTYGDTLHADDYRYVLRTVDRYGVANPFEIPFRFETALFANGTIVNDLDVIPPTAAMTMLVLSPKPLDPATDLELRVGGALQGFVPTPANGDTSRREWTLSWDHAPYAFGEMPVELRARNGATRVHRFQINVTGAELRIVNPLAFPNPFEDDLGTRFSFTLESATPVDLQIRVFTVSGRRVYERKLLGLTPSYQQIEWDGRDAEGSTLANGIYLYRLVAKNASSSAVYEGRLVKLRKPRRFVDDTQTVTP